MKQEESGARLQRGLLLKMPPLISLQNFRTEDGRLNIGVLVRDILSSLSKNTISDYYRLTQLSNEEARSAREYFNSKQLEENCSVEIGSIADMRDKQLSYEAVFRRKG